MSLRTWKRKPGCVREAKPFRVIVRGPVFWAAILLLLMLPCLFSLLTISRPNPSLYKEGSEISIMSQSSFTGGFFYVSICSVIETMQTLSGWVCLDGKNRLIFGGARVKVWSRSRSEHDPRGKKFGHYPGCSTFPLQELPILRFNPLRIALPVHVRKGPVQFGNIHVVSDTIKPFKHGSHVGALLFNDGQR